MEKCISCSWEKPADLSVAHSFWKCGGKQSKFCICKVYLPAHFILDRHPACVCTYICTYISSSGVEIPALISEMILQKFFFSSAVKMASLFQNNSLHFFWIAWHGYFYSLPSFLPSVHKSIDCPSILWFCCWCSVSVSFLWQGLFPPDLWRTFM